MVDQPPCTCLRDFNRDALDGHPNPEGMQELLSGPHDCSQFHDPAPPALTSLDPPERESPAGQPSPGGGFLEPDPSSDASLPFETRLAIAAVQHALADVDRPIVTPPSLSVDFRHSGWQPNRLLVYQALRRTEQPLSRKTSFANCGSDAYVLQNIENPDVYRLAGSACHDRFCLPCAQERSRHVALNVLELTEGRRIRFLTLTLKASSDPLAAQLDKLYTGFQALRRRALWKQKVTGGVAFLELTWSHRTSTWHPHFHILIEGSFLPYQQIKSLWYEITGDSFVIDIRAIRDLRQASTYVTKYASKPFNNTFLGRDAQLDEAILALKGRKLLLTFGSWRGITLIETPSDGSWEHVAPLNTIITHAAHGDETARSILRKLTDNDLSPLYARVGPRPPPEQNPGPVISQLTFFGVWQADGFYAFPPLHPTTTSEKIRDGAVRELTES